MAITVFTDALKGVLKNKEGKALYMQTSADKVVYDGSVSVADKLGEIAAHEAEYYDSANKKLLMSAMPEILQHNKGTFTNAAAFPAEGNVAGDFGINAETDTVWIYDAETSAWVDSDRKGQVSSVNGKTGEVTLAIADIENLQSALDAKVAIADIVDALDSEETAKPLSAKQGKVLDLKASALDIAVVANGEEAPATLRDNGMYIELDA